MGRESRNTRPLTADEIAEVTDTVREFRAVDIDFPATNVRAYMYMAWGASGAEPHTQETESYIETVEQAIKEVYDQ